MKKANSLQDLSIEKFSSLVQKLLKDQIRQSKSLNSEIEVMTRTEVAKFFKVDISTVSNWVERGILKPYGIPSSSRVYFLKSDLIEALTPVK